jgi:hypothetical protein
MKYKLIIISLMGIMLFGVEGCSSDGPESLCSFSPWVHLIYTDMDGNSSFQELNNADKYVLDKNIFEIISVKDSEGNIVKIRNVTSGAKQPRPGGMGFTIDETFSLQSPYTIREYTIKYKVRAIFGEDHIETLYLKYEVVNPGFTDCRYNNEPVIIVDPWSVVPEHENADDVDWDKVHQDRDALLFSGKTTASLSGDDALIIIPVEKVVEN